MNAELRKRLEAEEKALLDLFERSKIERDVYDKRLISLAYEYATLGDPDFAGVLLCKIPEEYYRQVLPSQMESDPNFAVEAFGLAEKLVSSNVVTLEQEYQFHRAPAQA